MWYTPLHTDRGIMRIDTIFQVNGDVPAVLDIFWQRVSGSDVGQDSGLEFKIGNRRYRLHQWFPGRDCMEPKIFTTYRLVKNEDLNHHGTLFAGRSAEWFVEAGFIAAAGLTRPENIVCLKVHGMTFVRPVQPGEIIEFQSRIILAGSSSLHAHVRMRAKEEFVMEGFITFVHVDHDGRAQPHGIAITATCPEDQALQERVRVLLA
jgi:acyl-CoA hydrolase